ncbi:MAG: Stp1/IreP family PP2C-type Ser/Thr phosphatase [Bdellovibrionales bacterium]|nr:Stp1/IreP family PP2C-type Ser/Thr phosphatase [Bdellovibrionales bacterium]
MLLNRNQNTPAEGFKNSKAKMPAAITDTGCERELNEDRYAVVECDSGLAWLVCDGMGGVTGGELAAQLAIDAMRRDLESGKARSPEVALKNSVVEANRVIVLRRQNPAFASMGTTVTGAIFCGSEVDVCNVGDSRAYLIRDAAIQQLTKDHTYVQRLVDNGEITADQALSHPKAHVLTRCIGSEPGLEIDINKFWIWESEDEREDFLLLCTDGLYSHVTDSEIAQIVAANSPQKACVKLVELAKERGGYDNITVAVIPLGGQLKKEPPAGYLENSVVNSSFDEAHEYDEQESSTKNLLQVFLIILLLSALSAVATTLVMAFSISG